MNAQQWYQRGRDAEAFGTPAALAEALRCFDEARALLSRDTRDPESVRLLGRVWMNRGNLLQRQPTPAAVADAISAYDAAITCFQSLLPHLAPTAPDAAPTVSPTAGPDAKVRNTDFTLSDPTVVNHLGAAWLNRGHALQRFADPARLGEALRSFRAAANLLRPIAGARTEPSAPANLAGALINLADTLIASTEPDRLEAALAAAREALALAATMENSEPLWAELGLMARRAHAIALGARLVEAVSPELVGEASDTIESGLALVRRWDADPNHPLQPFAQRFFRFGAELYRRHQPHFLAEFVLETLAAPDSPPAWVADREFQCAACEAVDGALADLRAPRLLFADDPLTERTLATHRGLTLAAAWLHTLFRPEDPPITA